MSLRTKLATAFGFTFVLLLGVLVAGVGQLDAVRRATEEIQSTVLPKIEALNALELAAASHRQLATGRMFITDFRLLAEMDAEMTSLVDSARDRVAQFREMIHTPSEARLFEQLLDEWRGYLANFEAAVGEMDSGGADAALRRFDQEALTAFERSRVLLERLAAMTAEQSEQARNQAREVYGRAVALVGALAGIGIAVSVLILVWISRRVSTPLHDVSVAMRRIADGDETASIPDSSGRRDEIGVLQAAAADFQHAVTRARELAEIATTERNRLRTAIANMPIGFCMYDNDDRLIVANDKYAELYKLAPEALKAGTPHSAVLEARVESGVYAGESPQSFRAEVERVVAAREPHPWILELADGRVISTIFQPMPSGWLATHEDITYRRDVEQRLRHMARHDPLTDLPNRLHFNEKLDQAMVGAERGEAVAVLVMDLDRFKAVNDSLGHPAGDALLVAVANRLRKCVRESDTVARLGGDEFAIVQLGARQPRAATQLAHRVIDSLGKVFSIDGQAVSIGASVGISLTPGDGKSGEELLKNADLALYLAKSDGRGVYRFFEPEMDARMQLRRQIEVDLRMALKKKQFELYYQPLIDLNSGKVTAFEALLRWPHPQRGMISPAEFVPVAEDAGLIGTIGHWVLKQACRDAASWPRDIGVAVNLSPAQFTDNALALEVGEALLASGLRPDRLELEITEGILLANTEETLAVLHEVRQMGVRVAMDDFGTGYSSLSYLRMFPFDKIKLDASFVTGISGDANSLAIIRAVAGLGASLGMSTTAEGVESEQQLAWVRQEGIVEAQGYLFSPARPASEVPALIKQLSGKAIAAA